MIKCHGDQVEMNLGPFCTRRISWIGHRCLSPQYGRSDLTVRCIESLFASTIRAEIKNLEIVVFDDGSPDSSATKWTQGLARP
jgi:hypothetical protein